MTTTAFDDQFTAEPEHVTHRAYDTAESAIAYSREDLQSFIDSRDAWMARAMAAESELKAARINEDCLKCSNRGKTNGLSQESFCDSCIYQGKSWRVNHFSGFSADQQSPAAKYMGRRMSPDGTKECWGFDIGDELPEGTLLYTRPIPAPEPAVQYGVDQEAANRISLAVYDWEKGINPEPLLYAINRILATEAHPLSEDGLRALLQSGGGK